MEVFFNSDIFQIGLELENPLIDFISSDEKIPIEEMASGAIIQGKERSKGEKKLKNTNKKAKQQINEENCRRGHWSLEENKRYHWFLEIYSNHFICKEMRRLDKIFKTMATFIGSREAEQCRSHHQKMEKKYICFAKIILYLRNVHYGIEDTYLLEEDLQANKISIGSELMSAKELKNLQEEKIEPPTPSLFTEEKINSFMNHEPLKDQLFPNTIEDIMNENYECKFDLDDLLF